MTTLQHPAMMNTDMRDLVKQNCEWQIKQLPMSSTEDLQNVSNNDKKKRIMTENSLLMGYKLS